MARIHIAYFLGTRPEVIRSAKTLRTLAGSHDVRLSIINSEQHYDDNMMGRFLRDLGIPPIDHQLGVGSASPAEQTSAIFSGASSALQELRPDCLCVFGDTNSSLGAGLAAAKTSVPLVHIEAGCRAFDMSLPEELNRRLLDHAAGLLLPVSKHSEENLIAESAPGFITRVSDPLYEIFMETVAGLPSAEPSGGLITIHRQENADDARRLNRILEAVERAGRDFDLAWTFPVHPRAARQIGGVRYDRISFVDPMPYRELVARLAGSRLCVTDSGGLQKEALWAGVPAVTVRRSTEWMETIEQGMNILASEPDAIRAAVATSLNPPRHRDASNPYGSGSGSAEIHDAVKTWIEGGAPFRLGQGSHPDGL